MRLDFLNLAKPAFADPVLLLHGVPTKILIVKDPDLSCIIPHGDHLVPFILRDIPDRGLQIQFQNLDKVFLILAVDPQIAVKAPDQQPRSLQELHALDVILGLQRGHTVVVLVPEPDRAVPCRGGQAVGPEVQLLDLVFLALEQVFEGEGHLLF